MQIFDAIYKKGNMLQCKFADNYIHPRYIGYEFPIGHHLIKAIAYNREYIRELYIKLITSYIYYIENGTDSDQSNFENALSKLDDHCIYLHETSYELLIAIEAAHPCYSLSNLMSFINRLDVDTARKFTEQLSRIKENNSLRLIACLDLWVIAVDFLLDEFDLLTNAIKTDILDICNAPIEATGLDRLSELDIKRSRQIFSMNFPVHLSYGLGNSKDSKFFLLQNLDEKNIVCSISVNSAEQLMYYDLFTTLENGIPIKRCKNCGIPFIPKGRIDSLYCDRIMFGFKDKCSVVGPLNTYKSKLPDIEVQFFAARKRYATRVSRKPQLKMQFSDWKTLSREKLTAYRNGEISADEFKNWFMDDEWMKK